MITAGIVIDTIALPSNVPLPYVSLTLAIVYVVDPPPKLAGVTAIVPLVVPEANVFTVPSLNVTVIDPVPVNPNVKFVVVPSQMLGVPLNVAVGFANTVTCAVEGIIVLTPFASTTLEIVYVVVAVGVPTVNGIPLVTLVIV